MQHVLEPEQLEFLVIVSTRFLSPHHYVMDNRAISHVRSSSVLRPAAGPASLRFRTYVATSLRPSPNFIRLLSSPNLAPQPRDILHECMERFENDSGRICGATPTKDWRARTRTKDKDEESERNKQPFGVREFRELILPAVIYGGGFRDSIVCRVLAFFSHYC